MPLACFFKCFVIFSISQTICILGLSSIHVSAIFIVSLPRYLYGLDLTSVGHESVQESSHSVCSFVCSEDLTVLVQRKLRITFKFAAVTLIVTNCLVNLGLKCPPNTLLHVQPVFLDSGGASLASHPCSRNGDIVVPLFGTVNNVVDKQITF